MLLQQVRQLLLVEAGNHLVPDANNRHEILTRNPHHLIGFVPVVGYIVFWQGDAVLRKKPLGLFAGGSGGQGVDGYLLIRQYRATLKLDRWGWYVVPGVMQPLL